MDPDVAAALQKLSEAEADRLLDRPGLRAARREWRRQCAIRFACDLLRKHVGSDVVRSRLMRQYEVSEPTAFRYFAKALKSLSRLPEP